MRLLMIGLILLAVLAAGGTALMVKRYLDSQAEAQANLAATKVEEPAVYVIVADEKLAIGTTLSDGALRWQKWPEDAVQDDFISSNTKDAKLVKKLVGATTRQTVATGTPISEEMVFRRGKAGFMSGIVDKGKRAVAINVDVNSGAGGFILPGDRVDVLLTFDARQITQGLGRPKANEAQTDQSSGPVDIGPAKYSTETVLRDIRILAMDQNFKDVDTEAAVAKSTTLEVSPKQAEILAVARAMGKLSLALRGRETGGAEIESGSYTSDVDISPTLRKIITQLSKKKKPPPKKSKATGVIVIRGGGETTQGTPAQ